VATTTEAGDEVIAWIYWYNKDVTGKPIIESENMMDYLERKQS
jgi:gamma-glutamylcyclotransferase (GGCT)/AIG2-like uncharacterized protein YtfP